MAKAVVNNAASVHQRLLNLARERKEDFGLVLTKYVLERALYRISQSKYRDVFVLKGALSSNCGRHNDIARPAMRISSRAAKTRRNDSSRFSKKCVVRKCWMTDCALIPPVSRRSELARTQIMRA
jgi:hypothetical protein